MRFLLYGGKIALSRMVPKKELAIMKSAEKTNSSSLIPAETIEQKIFLVRGQKVMFDKDLATLYEVKTKELNKNLRFHFGTSNRGGRRYLPYAFTEQGIAMLSRVLSSNRAILKSQFVISSWAF